MYSICVVVFVNKLSYLDLLYNCNFNCRIAVYHLKPRVFYWGIVEEMSSCFSVACIRSVRTG